MVHLGTSEMATPSVTKCLVEQDVTMADALAAEPDLEVLKAAMVREYSIRVAMLETGEDRQTIVDTMDAVASMDQEAVLELTSGAPTTLADGLQAYIEGLEIDADQDETLGKVASELHALLVYPWPEEEATIATHGENASVGLRVEPTEDGTTVWVGGQKVVDIGRGSIGIEGLASVQATAEAVHRAVLERVIGDRDHIVQLSRNERLELLGFLDGPNGNWSDDDRLRVDAVEDGGVLIRTQPYKYVVPPRSRDFAQDA